jgi:hypothetical protein
VGKCWGEGLWVTALGHPLWSELWESSSSRPEEGERRLGDANDGSAG